MALQNNFNNKLVNGLKSVLTNTGTGALLYIDSSGYVVVLPVGTNGQILGLTGGLPAWQTGVSPTGNAGGDLTGTYPNPTIATNTVTYAKMQDVSATNRILGRITAGAGDPEELTAANVATILGLGTAAYVNTGTTNGTVPLLDSSGYLPTSTIPPLRSHEYYEVASQAARLALTTSQVQPGDTVYQTDTNEYYILTTTDPSVNGNWRLLVDTTIPASYITSGTLATARLGSGTANISSYLRGDSTWVTLSDLATFTWNTVSGTSQTMVTNNGYRTTNVALTTLTLPTTAAVDTTMRVVGSGTGGWKIAQNASQQIRFLGTTAGTTATTSGVTGYIDAGVVTGSDVMASIEIMCTTANTTWDVISCNGNVNIN